MRRPAARRKGGSVSYIGEPFTHDLFVSYSHGTIEGEALSPLKRWSDAFIRELERELRTNPKYAGICDLLRRSPAERGRA